MNKKRTVTAEILFNDTGDFMAYRSAEHWLKEHGYSCGSMCSPMPTAIMKGDVFIAKWKNLTAKEIAQVDGVLIADSFRDGPCKVLLYDQTY